MDDVVADITKELGGTEPTLSVETVENGFGATLQKRKAVWHARDLIVSAIEEKDFKYDDLGIAVAVADANYLSKKEAERQATRSSTIK
jgi:hypothetical protein